MTREIAERLNSEGERSKDRGSGLLSRFIMCSTRGRRTKEGAVYEHPKANLDKKKRKIQVKG